MELRRCSQEKGLKEGMATKHGLSGHLKRVEVGQIAKQLRAIRPFLE